MDHRKRIEGFKGEYAWLSNMQLCKNGVTIDSLYTRSAEHMYICHKTLKYEERNLFIYDGIYGKDPYEAKKKGSLRAGLITLRPDWDEVKLTVMFDVVMAKFSQNEDLREKLLSTDDWYLEETNWWNDTYWGVCNGKGHNMLGHILMQVREEL